MIAGNDSRYSSGETLSVATHQYAENGDIENDDQGLPLEVSHNTIYLVPSTAPIIPPQQYMVKQTDDISLLAYKALSDPTKWWLVADVNPQLWYPLALSMGDVLALPQ